MLDINFLNRKYNILTGAVHNHTEHSYDSTAKIEDVLEAAKVNRLDYLTINDHHAIFPDELLDSALKELKEKTKYEPIVIVGTELNDKNKAHHILIFDKEFPLENSSIESYLELLKSREEISFAAHPYEERVSDKYPLYTWNKLDLLEKVTGLEIWNFSSSWLSKLNPKVNGLLLLIFPNLFVRKPFKQSLILWDNLNRKGLRKSAIGSTDAHSTAYKLGFINITVLSHKYLFGTIRTNLLIDQSVPVSRVSILKALAKGNSYIVNYRLGNPMRFYAGIGHTAGFGVSFGEEIPWEEDLKFYFRLPHNARVSLIKDGEIIDEQVHYYGSFDLKGKGYYRLQIERNGMGWIYTNNIYVIEGEPLSKTFKNKELESVWKEF